MPPFGVRTGPTPTFGSTRPIFIQKPRPTAWTGPTHQWPPGVRHAGGGGGGQSRETRWTMNGGRPGEFRADQERRRSDTSGKGDRERRRNRQEDTADDQWQHVDIGMPVSLDVDPAIMAAVLDGPDPDLLANGLNENGRAVVAAALQTLQIIVETATGIKAYADLARALHTIYREGKLTPANEAALLSAILSCAKVPRGITGAVLATYDNVASVLGLPSTATLVIQPALPHLATAVRAVPPREQNAYSG